MNLSLDNLEDLLFAVEASQVKINYQTFDLIDCPSLADVHFGYPKICFEHKISDFESVQPFFF